ncbi:uncharacterized protein LOC111350574 [Spodoptera litura]|uniref:Uncharacterized protein LOC111350574 n=1 Tax=Spodoptera litura TaxID=69820 RepID=A0A9J7INY3_SPOLT|nr:uncharacterized protein LOC111350574 [Spodoptera litura]
MSEDYLELADGLSKVTSDKFWNPSASFIIVVQNVEEYSLYDLTHLLHTYNIFHKVSVISRDGDDYSIYSYNFTNAGYCLKDNHLTFWMRCSDYIHSVGKLLPPVQKGTIRGCQYRLVTRNLWPLVNFHTDTEGIEQFFLSLFIKQYGVKIDLHEYKKVDRFGKRYDNETHILIKKVLDNEFEGVFGGYEINSVYSDSAFIIPYAIQADLFSATARPVRGFEPKEATELQNYKPVLYSEWQHRNKFDGHFDCGTRRNCLLTVRNCPNRSLYTLVSGCHYRVNQRYLTNNQCELMTYKLKEPYVSIYRTIYLRRGSALIGPLNNFILQSSPTGILTKYSSDIYSREWFKCKSRDRPQKVALTLENFYNAFMILIGGYCLSILSFLYEVLIAKIYRKHA